MNPIFKRIIGQGPPLIMLHGWGWHSGIWEPCLPELSKHFQLILLDLPGFGQSPLGNCSYGISELSKLILDIIPEQATWLGWSLGGMIAWWIAINYPQNVKHLITVGSSPCFLKQSQWPGVPLEVLEKFAVSLNKNYEQTLNDFLTLQLRGTPEANLLLNYLKPLFTAYTPSQTTLTKSLNLLKTLDLRPHFHKLTMPSTHIFGALDTLVPHTITALLAPQLIYAKIYTIPRTGHLPFLTHTDYFLSLITQEAHLLTDQKQ